MEVRVMTVRKKMNFSYLGCFNLQLSQRPKSAMNCLIDSEDWQFYILSGLFNLSNAGLRTVLKSPPIIIRESDKLEIAMKTTQKNRCHHCLVHKCWL